MDLVVSDRNKPRDRDPIEWHAGIGALITMVGSLLGFGIYGLVVDKNRWTSAVMLVIGLLSAVGMVRHMLLPIRQPPPDNRDDRPEYIVWRERRGHWEPLERRGFFWHRRD